jgi:4-diphosphocytidyl-2-C-methyl-D-erythritol kinase
MREIAPAKLTLSLRVTGVRADGYHELDAVMVTVSEPYDVVTIEPADAMSLRVTGPSADRVPADATNLAWRAAAACGATVAITIEKHIPPGGGLGGGSADAAAVLRALGGTEATGATIGADVPFCMRGGAARVQGIGDIVAPVRVHPRTVFIATPRFACDTAAVYRAWDELGGPHADPNDLEPAAFAVEPLLREFKDALGVPAVLAGSGSSFWSDAEPEPVDGRVWRAELPWSPKPT